MRSDTALAADSNSEEDISNLGNADDIASNISNNKYQRIEMISVEKNEKEQTQAEDLVPLSKGPGAGVTSSEHVLNSEEIMSDLGVRQAMKYFPPQSRL